jgi:imidazolonepropionase-like amidohydrolase
MRRASIGVALGLSILAFVFVGAQQPAPVAFEGARLLIGDGRVIDNGIVIVERGRIARVGRSGEVRRPANAARVDLSGKTMMPTLIDAHMHMGFENMSGWAARNYTRANVVDTLDRLAYYGVGAVFSAGTDPVELAQEIQRDQASGKVGGARFVFAAGAGPPGAGPNATLLKELGTLGKPVVHGITGDADARQMVKEVAAQRIPIIKVWVTDRGGTQAKTAPAAYRALIDEAHKHDIRVVAHATDGLADAKDLARAGLDGYIHGVLEADAEFAAMAKKNDAFVTPAQGLGLRGNIPGLEPWFEDPFFQEAAPPATIERYRQQQAKLAPPQPNALTLQQRYERAGRMIKVLLDGGVRIAVGTDAGATPDYPPGYPAHREMEIYTKSGMTPDQVITAATKGGAEALRLDREMGTLEAGKLANLLVLDADPRADIRNTHRIARVYLQGREVDRAALRKKWNPSGTR